MNEMLQYMARKVKEFNETVTGVVYDGGMIPVERMRQRLNHMHEELQEVSDAFEDNKAHDVVDGLVDLMYLCLGTLLEMGVPPDFAFDEVHKANMKKRRGTSQRNGNYEAVKPAGWEPPNHEALLERVRTLQQVSPVLVELTKLRIHKSKNYNRGTVKREDHFPLGHASYLQMVWVKAIRLRSFVESLEGMDEYARKDTEKLIARELPDLLAYGTFWVEWIQGDGSVNR